jgi:hypothetical protein
MRRETKERARRLLKMQEARGLIWTGSFKDLCRAMQKAEWELAMEVMGTALAARSLYSLRGASNRGSMRGTDTVQ